MSKEANGPDLFKVEDFVIFCGDKKFKVTLKTKKGIKAVFGKFTKKGEIVHLLVKVGIKRTSESRYKSFGPKIPIIYFG